MKEISAPKISIIVPVYNRESCLRRCLDSILSQTFTGFECIIIDDCSTDKSPQICDAYARQDPRIKVIHSAKNEGSSLARKTGFENSRGEYIQFVDSDDWLEPDMTERMYKRAISENFDIVYCDYISYWEDGCYSLHPYDARGLDNQQIVNDIITDRMKGMLWYKMYSRKLFYNITFPVLQSQEDRVINTQLFLNAKKIGYEYSILYHQLIHKNSITQGAEGDIEEAFSNLQLLNDIMARRTDYELYKASLENEIEKYKNKLKDEAEKQKTFKNLIKKTVKLALPYGFLKIYWRCKKQKYG